jgi:hypothetical protein
VAGVVVAAVARVPLDLEAEALVPDVPADHLAVSVAVEALALLELFLVAAAVAAREPAAASSDEPVRVTCAVIDYSVRICAEFAIKYLSNKVPKGI